MAIRPLRFLASVFAQIAGLIPLGCITIVSLLACISLLLTQEQQRSSRERDQTYSPFIAPASNEGLLAIKRMQLPADLKVDLVAAEPLLANPVAFSIDERGRFYVAETFRVNAGVTDTRDHMYWL